MNKLANRAKGPYGFVCWAIYVTKSGAVFAEHDEAIYHTGQKVFHGFYSTLMSRDVLYT